MTQLHFQLQDGRKLGYGAMNGIPMVATSPVRHHDSPVMNPVEIHSYEPPWKALTDFALHTDLDRLNNGPPPGQFQHLVNQVSRMVKCRLVFLIDSDDSTRLIVGLSNLPGKSGL